MISQHKEGLNYWPSFVDIFASLFFIFLILFAVYYLTMQKSEEAAKAAQKDIDDLEKMVKALNIELDGDNNLVISGDLLFDNGKSSIKSGKAEIFATSFAAELSKYFKTTERQKKYAIVVEGHTDTLGPEEFNNNLSLNRALSFIEHIENNLDLNLTSKIEFIPAGFGETKLRVQTDDNKSERRNRRVVIRIMPKFNRTLDNIFKQIEI